MEKVYVVYEVDDPYSGYWIEKIFSNEEAAKGYCEYYNSQDYMIFDYFELEVFDNFVIGGK